MSNHLNLFWDAFTNMFEHDRSAARSQMTTHKLIVFKHDSRMDKAHAHQLFDLVQVSPARVTGINHPALFRITELILTKPKFRQAYSIYEKI